MLSIRPYKGGALENLETFQHRGIKKDTVLLMPAKARKRFHGLFEEAHWDTVEKLLWDLHAAWTEAAQASQAIIQIAIDQGVVYHASTVGLFLSVGECVGVETEQGGKTLADRTLSCIGADIAELLAKSAPSQPDLQVECRFVAGTITVAKVKLTPEQLKLYKNTPAVLCDASPAHGLAMRARTHPIVLTAL